MTDLCSPWIIWPNTAFSARRQEISENGSFSQEIGAFLLFFLLTAGRSFVENDRLA
jgi:hypothetical protein